MSIISFLAGLSLVEARRKEQGPHLGLLEQPNLSKDDRRTTNSSNTPL